MMRLPTNTRLHILGLKTTVATISIIERTAGALLREHSPIPVFTLIPVKTNAASIFKAALLHKTRLFVLHPPLILRLVLLVHLPQFASTTEHERPTDPETQKGELEMIREARRNNSVISWKE